MGRWALRFLPIPFYRQSLLNIKRPRFRYNKGSGVALFLLCDNLKNEKGGSGAQIKAHFARSARISFFSASTPRRTAELVSSVIF